MTMETMEDAMAKAERVKITRNRRIKIKRTIKNKENLLELL